MNRRNFLKSAATLTGGTPFLANGQAQENTQTDDMRMQIKAIMQDELLTYTTRYTDLSQPSGVTWKTGYMDVGGQLAHKRKFLGAVLHHPNSSYCNSEGYWENKDWIAFSKLTFSVSKEVVNGCSYDVSGNFSESLKGTFSYGGGKYLANLFGNLLLCPSTHLLEADIGPHSPYYEHLRDLKITAVFPRVLVREYGYFGPEN